MNYKIYGPYEIPLQEGEFKKRIDKEDISEFWDSVDAGLEYACGVYVFTIKKGSKEMPWYVGKAKNQSFFKECFTAHKIIKYHDALEKSKGVPRMYFLARMTPKGSMSNPSKIKSGHAAVDFVEQMLIMLGYQKNNAIRNVQGTKFAKDLVVEGFVNHKDRRRKVVKQLQEIFDS